MPRTFTKPPSIREVRQQWQANQAEENSPDEDQQAAVAQLERFLESKYLLGLYPATDVAELAHLITRASVSSPLLKALSSDPLLPSFRNNAARKVAVALDLDQVEKQLYLAQVPMYDPEADARQLRQFPMRLPHEVVADDFQAHPQVWKRAARQLQTVNWAQHAVRQEDPAAVPVGLLVDGITVTKTDSTTVVPQRCW